MDAQEIIVGKNEIERSFWSSIVGRCLHPKHELYGIYGKRGVCMDRRWEKFTNFLADVGTRPEVGMLLLRSDVNKGYTKDNVYWGYLSQPPGTKLSSAALEKLRKLSSENPDIVIETIDVDEEELATSFDGNANLIPLRIPPAVQHIPLYMPNRAAHDKERDEIKINIAKRKANKEIEGPPKEKKKIRGKAKHFFMYLGEERSLYEISRLAEVSYATLYQKCIMHKKDLQETIQTERRRLNAIPEAA